MGPNKNSAITDDDSEIIFVTEVARKGPKTEKISEKSAVSCDPMISGKSLFKSSPKYRRLKKTVPKEMEHSSTETDGNESLCDEIPIAVISNTFSLAPNELDWAPEMDISVVQDSNYLEPSPVIERQLPAKMEGNRLKVKPVGAKINPCEFIEHRQEETRHGNNPTSFAQTDRPLDDSVGSQSTSINNYLPLFANMLETVGRQLHYHNEFESLRQQITVLSQQVNKIDNASATHHCSCAHGNVKDVELPPPITKIELVDLDSSSDEEGYNSESTESNERSAAKFPKKTNRQLFIEEPGQSVQSKPVQEVSTDNSANPEGASSNEVDNASAQCSCSLEHRRTIVPKIEFVDISLSSDEELEEDNAPQETESREAVDQDENASSQSTETNASIQQPSNETVAEETKIDDSEVHNEPNVANATQLESAKLVEQPVVKEDPSAFIPHCKVIMRDRGLNYNDFINYLDDQGCVFNENQVSMFMNNKLCEKTTCKLLILLKQFLQNDNVQQTKLSDDVVNDIDYGRLIMKVRDLHNIDFITWARVRLGISLNPSVIGYFMNKKLNERRTQKFLPLFLKFIDDETYNVKLKRQQNSGELTPRQIAILKESLSANPYPSRSRIRYLSKHLHTSRSKIRGWFLDRNDKEPK